MDSFHLHYDRHYGTQYEPGWSVSINGIVFVQLARTPIGAALRAWWRWVLYEMVSQ